jgi:Arc/MetJ-type ribon-helix-helix transcriptional regulator
VDKPINTKETRDLKQINIRIGKKQDQQLEELSKALGDVSKSNLVRIAIAELLYKYRYF